MEMQRG